MLTAWEAPFDSEKIRSKQVRILPERGRKEEEMKKEMLAIKLSDDAREINAKDIIIIGLHYKRNNITRVNPLDLRGMRNLLVVDLDYFLKHRSDVLLAVKSVKNI